MSIEATGTVEVRLRFTDGLGNYSRRYTTASIEVGACFPLSDPMDGTDLVGELSGSAEYLSEDGYVRLTTNETSLNGYVTYEPCTLPEVFSVEFDFRHMDGSADAVYFYFHCDEKPTNENGIFSDENDEEEEELIVTGYVIGFDEYESEVTVTYGMGGTENDETDDEASSAAFEFSSETWYRAKITYSAGSVWVYIDGDLVLTTSGLPTDLNEDQIKWGIAARTGSGSAEHHVRDVEVYEDETPVIPDVEDFMLFSWGKQVWATWEPNSYYQTELEFEIGEEWAEVGEEFVDSGIGEY